MKKTLLAFLLMCYTFSSAQGNYKYVIVPKKFSFFEQENKYNTNYLTKTFFEKQGFQVVYDTDEFPDDLALNRCLALVADALQNKNLFLTKISIELRDCSNKIVYTSEQGITKEKEYNKAYNIAFRAALSSLKSIKPKSDAIVLANTLAAEVENTKISLLTAIPTSKGYDLLDEDKENIFTLQKTSLENVYSAKKRTLIGTFFKKNDGWIFEYYDNDELIQESVNVTF